MTSPLAEDLRGNRLLRFVPSADGKDVAAAADGIPVTVALVAAFRGAAPLLVFNRWRQHWELPGGFIDAGESAARAAVREYVEETGQPAVDLEYAGLAVMCLQPGDRLEAAAVFRAQVATLADFVENGEVERIQFWDPGDASAGPAPLDAEIIRRVAGVA